MELRIRWNCLRRGLGLKDGPGSARTSTVSVRLGWWFILSPSARTGLADLADRAKVVQPGGCSTFTRSAKPATRRVADGERMNPRKECTFALNAEDDEHQDGGQLGATRMNDSPVLLTSADSRQERRRGHGLI